MKTLITDALLVEINRRKGILLELATTKGISSNETIEYSQALDGLLFLYQRSKAGMLF